MRKYFKFGLLTLVSVWLGIIVVFTIPKLVALHREKLAVEAVVGSYIQALEQDRYAHAYDFCGPDFRAALSSSQFAEQQNTFRSKYGRLLESRRQGLKVSESGTPAFWTA